ncbi:MAG: hypothetical protein ACTSUE_17550 [Promethearchaeota archaeon]
MLSSPGFIPVKMNIHYYVLARLVEDKISAVVKKNLYFRVAREIKETDEHVFFEFGYIDQYFHDFWIESFQDPGTTVDALLKDIEIFYSSTVPCRGSYFYKENGRHVYIRFASNREVEEIYELMVRINTENAKIVRDLIKETGKKLKRKWYPVERYKDKAYAVINLRANLGYLMIQHVKTSHETYKYTGICAHWEERGGVWRIYCKDRLDFDVLFTPMNDSKKRYEIYKRLDDDPDEFMRRRLELLQKHMDEIRETRELFEGRLKDK